jgi:DNA polymerase III sliding clamp (beta) subunit (PCNA family)
MKARCSQVTLSSLCKAAKGFATTKSTINTLRGLKLEVFEDELGGCVVVSGTDLKSGLRVWGKAVVEELGIVVVDAETFTAFVSALDELALIDLSTTKGRLVVKARTAEATFALLPLNEYPEVAHDQEVECFTMNANALGTMLQNASRFTL